MTPSSSNTSAAPHLLDADRFPCFATGTPAAEITIEEVVDMLNVFDPSPPVPTISRTSLSFSNLTQCALMASAEAVISSIVSPFMDIAVK